jgi:DNA repair protein RecN (Recombination protein N)
MLARLSIRDFAVVAHAELVFGPGLTVISGETGAGKSLLVDALGFLCGARAEAGAVRHGSDRAELAAEFLLERHPAALQWLRDMELDDGEACLLRRTLRADGGSRAWINGRAATLAQLAELTGLLVQIHGQHEQQALLSRAHQTGLLDAYARHPALQASTRAAAQDWRRLQAEREALLARGDVGERRAWLQHQLDELSAESLDPLALADLDASHRRQANAASLIAACDDAVERLVGERSLAAQLRQLRSGLQRESVHDPRLGEVDAMLESASIQLDEALPLLERIRDDLDLDPQALAALEQRLVRVQDLARKHRIPVEGLARHRDALADELAGLVDADARLRVLDGELGSAFAAWQAAAGALTASRTRASQRLAREVDAMLGALGMQGGAFAVELQAVADQQPDPDGAERVELQVSANPGQPLRALRKVASGGELSRLSLAIEVATQGADGAHTLVFDEVDAGIGGAVAAAVGARLRALGTTRQVLCVTHQPQVAAAGHAQYRVSKAAHAGITQSQVALLDADGRIGEIARMLGGAQVTGEAEAAARRLLAETD